ncbi:MAG: OsmC family protein [Anaerolineae bacterium]|jgi:putative redox protein
MGEQVVVRQDRDFIIDVWAGDPHEPGSEDLHEVHHVHQLTPYGMLMTSLGSCTAIVLHTYAQHHGIDLAEVEIRLDYDRIFAEDCADCETINEYREHIEEEISLTGHLTEHERHKLRVVSRHCSIHKILTQGMEVDSHLVES